MDSNLLTQIGQFGFPIVISIYLLVRMEKKVEDLTKAINDLNYNVSVMNPEKNTITKLKKID